MDFPPCFDTCLSGGCGLLHFGAAVLKIAEDRFHWLQRGMIQGIGKPRGDFFHVDAENSRVKLPFEVRADLADVRGSMPNLVMGKADGAGCLALSFRLRLELRAKTVEKIAERLKQLAVVLLRDGLQERAVGFEQQDQRKEGVSAPASLKARAKEFLGGFALCRRGEERDRGFPVAIEPSSSGSVSEFMTLR